MNRSQVEIQLDKYRESYRRNRACLTLVEMGLAYRDAGHPELAADCFRQYTEDPSPPEEKLYPINEVKALLASVS